MARIRRIQKKTLHVLLHCDCILIIFLKGLCIFVKFGLEIPLQLSVQ